VKHIKTLNGDSLTRSALTGGCGECQTSCQSACKTSCTVANQKCENRQNKEKKPLGDKKAS
jgi:predicted ribosomally synthesized six-cysteine peptide SCIFF